MCVRNVPADSDDGGEVGLTFRDAIAVVRGE